MDAILAYCGLPPLPGGLLWNFDPWLIAALLALAGLYGVVRLRDAGESRPPPDLRDGAFLAGWLITALAVISPLCHLSVALFSARVAQHMVLTLVAAPLIALALPARAGRGGEAGWAAALFAAALWIWHLPGPYDATLRSDLLYWIMHVSLVVTAIWLWRGIFDNAARPATALMLGFGTAAQMSLIAALLTFAPRALFGVHVGTTAPWGLTPIEDQQLGGLIMWVPGGAIFALVALVAFGRWVGSAAADGVGGAAEDGLRRPGDPAAPRA